METFVLWVEPKIFIVLEFLIVAQILLLLIVSWTDVAARVIGNAIVVLIALIGVLARLMVGPMSLFWSGLVALALFGVLLLPWRRGMLGGGDVKLIPAVALGLPPNAVLPFLSATALAGGVLALLHLAGRKMPAPARLPRDAGLVRRVWAAERRRMRRGGALPYGVAIAGGAMWALLAVPAA
jgi:prepilin peptidase CpaA